MTKVVDRLDELTELEHLFYFCKVWNGSFTEEYGYTDKLIMMHRKSIEGLGHYKTYRIHVELQRLKRESKEVMRAKFPKWVLWLLRIK
jgi:hypothetical protein